MIWPLNRWFCKPWQMHKFEMCEYIYENPAAGSFMARYSTMPWRVVVRAICTNCGRRRVLVFSSVSKAWGAGFQVDSPAYYSPWEEHWDFHKADDHCDISGSGKVVTPDKW